MTAIDGRITRRGPKRSTSAPNAGWPTAFTRRLAVAASASVERSEPSSSRIGLKRIPKAKLTPVPTKRTVKPAASADALAGHCRRGPRRAASIIHSLDDLEQLHLEDQGRPRPDAAPGAPVPVCQLGRADQPALPADLHLLQPLGPARDHLVQREHRRLTALDRAVEDGPVDERAVVVDLDPVGRLRRLPRPGLEGDDHEARAGPDGALLGGRLVEVRLARLLLDRRDLRRPGLLQLLNLRAVGLEVDLVLAVQDPVGEAGLHEFQLRLAQPERGEPVAEGEADRVERLLLLG